ncbi:MAG: hypothetical protein JWR19_1641 [Pedosphaera sp.]|nr:hypothetical protein [Pedosphaera sp.]
MLTGSGAYAQAPVNLLKFAFDDANTGSSFTTPSDTSLGGANITLNMVSGANAATDYHGQANSGVSRVNRALDFTSNTIQAGNPGPMASRIASSALGFGVVTNFVVTEWFKASRLITPTANLSPRMFVIGTNGATDLASNPNTIAMKLNTFSQIQIQVGNVAGQLYSANLAAAIPTNQWLFFAAVYDGTNMQIFTGSETAPATLVSSTAAPGLSVNFGTTGSVIIGNKGDRTRSFAGSIDDFRFYSGVGDASFVETVRQAAAPISIGNIYPNGLALQQATNSLSFTATSPNGINANGIKVVLNGADVTGQLLVSGPSPSPSQTVSFPGLLTNVIYTSSITVTDASGFVGTFPLNFDTFSPTNFIVEAEEFDFNNGMYIDNADYTDATWPADANSYFGLDSVELVDTHKGTGNGGVNASDYRAGAAVVTSTQTPAATGELLRPKFVNALDTNAVDHMVANTSNPDWQNYTKTFPAGNYNIYGRFSGGSGGSIPITVALVTSGWGTSSQTTSNLGTFNYTSSGATFQYAPLRDGVGNLATVNLAGTNTIRMTWGSGGQANFYMFVPANTNLPSISNVYPDGSVLFQATNKFAFTASSTSTTISTNSVQLTINGTNVSSSLVFTGTPASWNVSYPGLLLNQSYTVVISVTDANGNAVSSTLHIDTYNPLLQFEGEDFDFNNGQFIDNPVPTTSSAANSYFGVVGTELVDENGNNNATPITSLNGYNTANYRVNDRIMTSPISDAPRQQFLIASAPDHNLGFMGNGFWQNYTRTWPAGTYNIYARQASGVGVTVHTRLDEILSGWGTTAQLTKRIGTFNCPGTGGYAAYLYVPLLDQFGNYANVTLNGTNTLRMTVDNAININFYMLTAARTDLPRIDNVYPDGSVLLQGTNKLTFIASSPTGINTTNIQVTLNGVNISSNLVFTGSATSWNVSYTGLLPSTNYTAVINVTDLQGLHATTTVTFDTFNPTNYVWEAEDFDFEPTSSPVPNGSGLRYIDNPVPTSSPAANSYFGQVSTVDTDEHYVLYTGTHPYRSSDFIATEVTSDGTRQKYSNARLLALDPTIADYDVNFWTNTAWINYTRTFPSGNFNVYARLAGGNGAFNLPLAQVTSGWGTPVQTTQYLGTFKGTGTSFTTWQWVPLIDTNTLQAVVLPLGGTNTFQMTADGNENANFYMLVPAVVAPTAVSLTIVPSGPNVNISFPTQNGFNYTVTYKNNLNDPIWLNLSTVAGDGTVKSVNDPIGAGQRFYRLSIQ